MPEMANPSAVGRARILSPHLLVRWRLVVGNTTSGGGAATAATTSSSAPDEYRAIVARLMTPPMTPTNDEKRILKEYASNRARTISVGRSGWTSPSSMSKIVVDAATIADTSWTHSAGVCWMRDVHIIVIPVDDDVAVFSNYKEEKSRW